MSATWITQGVAEKGSVLLHISGKNPAFQGTFLGEAENPLDRQKAQRMELGVRNQCKGIRQDEGRIFLPGRTSAAPSLPWLSSLTSSCITGHSFGPSH